MSNTSHQQAAPSYLTLAIGEDWRRTSHQSTSRRKTGFNKLRLLAGHPSQQQPAASANCRPKITRKNHIFLHHIGLEINKSWLQASDN